MTPEDVGMVLLGAALGGLGFCLLNVFPRALRRDTDVWDVVFMVAWLIIAVAAGYLLGFRL